MNSTKQLQILLASPYLQSNRGNSITALRIQQGLEGIGLQVSSFAYAESLTGTSLLNMALKSDILHVFHAYRFAEVLHELDADQQKKLLNHPIVITMTGTDVNHDIYASYRASLMRPLLDACRAIIVLNQEAFKAMSDAFVHIAGKLHCISLAVSLPDNRNSVSLVKQGPPVLLFPAGIRRVKEISYLFDAFDVLYQEFSHLEIWLVGPILEADYGETILDHVHSRPYLKYLGEVAHEEMKNLYQQATAVLNSSISEGQPQAILEAMSEGALVVVRAITGNLAVVKHQKTGLVYHSPEDFILQMRQLLLNPESAFKIQEEASLYIKQHHSPEVETQQYLKLYKEVCNLE